jgi:hypothetical protein
MRHTYIHWRIPLEKWSACRGSLCAQKLQQTQEMIIHAPSEIRTRDPSNRVLQTHTLDRTTTDIGQYINV